jgi:hypothetical protein
LKDLLTVIDPLKVRRAQEPDSHQPGRFIAHCGLQREN